MSGTDQPQSAAEGAGYAANLTSIAGNNANETAIGTLYLEYYQSLVDYARGFVGLHDAKDIVHTVFSRILKRDPHWVGCENSRAAMFVAVQHVAVDLIRYRKRFDVVDPAELQEQETAILQTDVSERRERMRRWILGNLDPRFSQVLLLRMDGLRLREIAAALGLPPGTVKRRLQLARKKLRTAKEKVNHFGFSNVV
jgi:RNA polymerase sigma factor (sigma-70 family)